MSIYLVNGEVTDGRAFIQKRFMDGFPSIEKLEPNGFFVKELPQPETPEGFRSVLMVKLPVEGSEDEPELYYDYVAIPEPEETQLAKLRRQLDTLTAKASALSSGQEIQEDVITEIVMHVYK